MAQGLKQRHQLLIKGADHFYQRHFDERRGTQTATNNRENTLKKVTRSKTTQRNQETGYGTLFY
tara:strand:- start:423 stop:614 length:192 start_codon:yes stop_codon:yes gene_type:complete